MSRPAAPAAPLAIDASWTTALRCIRTSIAESTSRDEWLIRSSQNLEALQAALATMNKHKELASLYSRIMMATMWFPIRGKEMLLETCDQLLGVAPSAPSTVMTAAGGSSTFAQYHGGKIGPVTMTRDTLLQNLVGPSAETNAAKSASPLRLRTGLGASDIKDTTLFEVADVILASMDGQVSFASQCKEPHADVPCEMLVTKLLPLPTDGYFLELIFEVCPSAEGALLAVIVQRLANGSEVRVGFGLTACLNDRTLGELRLGEFDSLDMIESFKTRSHVEACIHAAWPKLLPKLSDLHPCFFDQQPSLRVSPHSGSSKINA